MIYTIFRDLKFKTDEMTYHSYSKWKEESLFNVEI